MKPYLKTFLEKLQGSEGPKVSIYMPTARTNPEVKKDRIVFKNFIQEAKATLEQKYDRKVWEPIVAKLEALHGDNDFWTYLQDGMAVFVDTQKLEKFLVEQEFPSKLVVQEQFYLFPFLEVSEGYDGGYLIDLSKDRLKIYQLTHYVARPLEQDVIKTSFPELFDDFDSESNLNFGSYGGDGNAFHGHRAKPEEDEKNREKYFRYVDEKLAELLENKETPVILSGTIDNVSEFKNVAKGKFYTQTAIEKPFSSLDHKEKRQEVVAILKPRQEKKQGTLLEDYGYRASQGQVVKEPAAILEAATEGRVDQLFVTKPYGYDASEDLSLIIQQVLNNAGDIILLEPEQFSDQIGATLRF